ncbi:MAG: winged helix-turn-helix domain-containing protein [Thermodesulfovibrio sp.]|uniref:winged helix-turn-helix domain-containing protein n=1 Tax=Caldisericum exile TaxID=693075 RepID=UPI003C73FD07
MRKIEIDEEVYRALQKLARPFEDTPNNVLRRLLGIDKASLEETKEEEIKKVEDYNSPIKEMIKTLNIKGASETRINRVHGAIPMKEYRLPILEALIEKGGKATQREVFEIIERKMKDQFNELDLQVLSDGHTLRWQKMVAWQRYRMVQDGLLRSDSPRGIWEITEIGRKYLKEVSHEI